MKQAEELEKILAEASVVTVAVHTHPDGDAIGSGCALARYIRQDKGKEAALLVPNPVPDTLSFILRDGDKVLTFETDPDKCMKWISRSDLIVCMDCNSFKRIEGAEPFLRSSHATKVLLDHHLNPESDSFGLVISKIEVSSASELLYQTFKEFKAIGGDITRLPMSCLEALMTGMTTDTNNFANSVFPSTLNMASDLLAAGVDRDSILSNLYNRYRENRLRLMGYMLHDNMEITDDGVAIMILDKQTQESFDFRQGETEGFVNMPLAIGKVRMSIFLTEEDKKFRVSVRSKKGVSANRFTMEYCNGGGHEQAAGGSLGKKDFPTAKELKAYILNVTKEFFSK